MSVSSDGSLRGRVQALNGEMGRDNSFGALRLLAALLVTLSHSFPIALGSGTPEPPYPLLPFSLGTVGVYMFFAISGILVTQSFVRSPSAARFLWHRFLRIYPALFVSLLLTTFIVAPLFGSSLRWFLTLEPYRHIFVNALLIKDAETGISGAFPTNPLPSAMNDPIWTLVWEVRAYLILLVFGTVLSVRKSWHGLALILLGVALSPLAIEYTGRQPQFLAAFFLGGLLWYVNQQSRYRLPIVGLASLVLVGTYGGALFNMAFTMWTVAMVFALGTIRTRAFRIFERIDPTYGLYLYSWPVGQILVSIFGISNPWVLAGLTTLIAGALAAASWFLVERPAMALKDWSPRPSRMQSEHQA